MKYYYFGAIALAVMAIAGTQVASAETQAHCDFSRTLELGATGEDVRCLQKFLNANGFVVAESGVGAPGSETTLYREKTKEAVKRWQAARGISPASGMFGPLSKAEYELQYTNGSVAPIPPVSVPVPTPAPAPAPQPSMSDDEENARGALQDAISAINDAEDEAENDAEDEDVNDSKDDLIKAFEFFFDNQFVKAQVYAERAAEGVEDILGKEKKDNAEEEIKDAEEAIDDARKEIEDADDNGDDVNDAEDVLKRAEDKLDDAKDAFDDEEYDQAISLAKKAQQYADDSVDAID